MKECQFTHHLIAKIQFKTLGRLAKLVSLMFLQVLLLVVVVLDLNNGTQILQEIHLHVLKTRLLSKRKAQEYISRKPTLASTLLGQHFMIAL